MKVLLAVFVSFLGVLLGIVLAGIGGSSAETMYFLDFPNKKEEQKIEAYWEKTGIGFSEVSQLINNRTCNSSAHYYKACLSALSQTALQLKKQIDVTTGRVVDLVPTDYLAEKNEKELVELYLTHLNSRLDFDKELQELLRNQNEEVLKPAFYARTINAFLSVYEDPHTYILPKNFYSDVGAKMSRSRLFVGISYEQQEGYFVIRRVSKNSDADLAGIRVNDRLMSVDNIDLRSLNNKEFSDIMTDENRSEFVFTLQRDQKVLTLKMIRSYRELNHVQYDTIQGEKKYAHVTFTKFGRGACVEIARAIQSAQEQKVSGMVLDLRDNSGGQMDEAACITGLFLGKNKKAYYVEYFAEDMPNEVGLTSEAQLYDGPLVILVNSSSASSSELLAGGLQEHGRALVVGERSFGKGSFQEPQSWSLNSRVALFKTQGFYLLPSRNTTQLRGIIPDVVIEENESARREENQYFNPLTIEANEYAGLAQREKVQAYSFSLCKNSDEIVLEDNYLNTAVDYLSCAQLMSPSLAEQKNIDTVQ